MDICAYNEHNRMIMNYGYEHIIIGSYIIYIEGNCRPRIKIQKSMCRLFAYKINELSWKDKTQKFEIFYLVNKIRFVFYVTKSNIT